jgi:hypothetical protein
MSCKKIRNAVFAMSALPRAIAGSLNVPELSGENRADALD